ncbi:MULTISPECIES: hypothetical protein [unclassified Achromobacter]|uniref:hypothetical protein n=1 Tax=unclassified Achromobacter TaxID=2626865 RepID=UPI001F2FC464|nr:MULTISPECIES: hypothetical protein [unclassified Achromobacter]
MRQLLECPVTFRLSADAHRRYEAAAKHSGMSLSQYLRARLETEDTVADQVAQLRLTLLDAGPDAAQPERAGTAPILTELLLLARRAAAPGDLRAVHAELERQGVRPWTPDRHQELPE